MTAVLVQPVSVSPIGKLNIPNIETNYNGIQLYCCGSSALVGHYFRCIPENVTSGTKNVKDLFDGKISLVEPVADFLDDVCSSSHEPSLTNFKTNTNEYIKNMFLAIATNCRDKLYVFDSNKLTNDRNRFINIATVFHNNNYNNNNANSEFKGTSIIPNEQRIIMTYNSLLQPPPKSTTQPTIKSLQDNKKIIDARIRAAIKTANNISTNTISYDRLVGVSMNICSDARSCISLDAKIATITAKIAPVASVLSADTTFDKIFKQSIGKTVHIGQAKTAAYNATSICNDIKISNALQMKHKNTFYALYIYFNAHARMWYNKDALEPVLNKHITALQRVDTDLSRPNGYIKHTTTPSTTTYNIGDQIPASHLAICATMWVQICMLNNFDTRDLEIGLTKLIATAFFVNLTSMNIEESGLNKSINNNNHIYGGKKNIYNILIIFLTILLIIVIIIVIIIARRVVNNISIHNNSVV